MNHPDDYEFDNDTEDNHFFDIEALEDDELGAYSGSNLFTYLGIEDRVTAASNPSSQYSC